MLSMITIDIKDKSLVGQQGCKKALPVFQELSDKKCHVSSPAKPVFACLRYPIIIVWIGIPQGDNETRR